MDWDAACALLREVAEEAETGMTGFRPFDVRADFAIVVFHADARRGGLPAAQRIELAVRLAFAVVAEGRGEAPPEELVRRATAEYARLFASDSATPEAEPGERALEVVTAYLLGWRRLELDIRGNARRPVILPCPPDWNTWHPINSEDFDWSGRYEGAMSMLDSFIRPIAQVWLACLRENNHGPQSGLRPRWWNHGVVGFRVERRADAWAGDVREDFLSARTPCGCGMHSPPDEGGSNRWFAACRDGHRLSAWDPPPRTLWEHARRATQGFDDGRPAPEPGGDVPNFRFGLLHHLLWLGRADSSAPPTRLVPQPVLLRQYAEDLESPHFDPDAVDVPLIVREEMVIIEVGLCDRRPGPPFVRAAGATWRAIRHCTACGSAEPEVGSAPCAVCGGTMLDSVAWDFRAP